MANMSSAGSSDAVAQIAGHLLLTRALQPSDRDALVALHRTVFQSDVDARWHAWKYGVAHGFGSGVWSDEKLVAHCGGLARILWLAGQQTAGLQIGDVMVEPQWRGILTRRGPFFHASQHFYSTQIGVRRPFQLGFGFPGERHLRLARAVGLLRDGGSILAMHWDTAHADAPAAWAWRWIPLNPDDATFDATVNHAWNTMKARSTSLAIGQRDAAYMRWRFVERPDRKHHFFMLRRPWSRTAAGIAVLDLHTPQSAHWLDWVGDPELMALACRACRAEAARHGLHRLEMWASPEVAQRLAATRWTHQTETVRLGIVNTSTLDEATTAKLRWWLMGGDTDFL